MEFKLLEKKIKWDRTRLLLILVYLIAISVLEYIGIGESINDYLYIGVLIILNINQTDMVLPMEDEKDSYELDKLIKRAGKKYNILVFAEYFVLVFLAVYSDNIVTQIALYTLGIVIALVIENKRNQVFKQIVADYVDRK